MDLMVASRGARGIQSLERGGWGVELCVGSLCGAVTEGLGFLA